MRYSIPIRSRSGRSHPMHFRPGWRQPWKTSTAPSTQKWWGGLYWVLPGRLVIRKASSGLSYFSLVVLRSWGLRSKYRKQLRGTSHCKGRGKQKEKHQCAMFWPGLICASEDTNRVLSTAKKALSIARYVWNREREIDSRVVLLGSYYEVGDYHELSVECGKRALSIAKEVGNRKRKADACAVLAWPNTA